MPIKSIQRWVLWSSLVISALLFVFSAPLRAQLEDWLTKQLHVPDYIALVTLFFVALFFLFAAGWLPRLAFRLSVLRRLVMRHQFVEGVWLDAVFDARDELKHVGIVNIKYDNGYLKANGNDYKPNGEWRSSFHTIFGEIIEPSVFRYCWVRQRVVEIEEDGDSGYAEYIFRGPVVFTGSYSSLTRHARNLVEGDKLTEELVGKELKMDVKKNYLISENDITELMQNYAKYKTDKKRKQYIPAQ